MKKVYYKEIEYEGESYLFSGARFWNLYQTDDKGNRVLKHTIPNNELDMRSIVNNILDNKTKNKQNE